jgi:hypothetical protein
MVAMKKIRTFSSPWQGTKVHFEPWCKRSQYEKGISGSKILILGESHHHRCDKDDKCKEQRLRSARHRGLTKAVVEQWKDEPHSSPVSSRLPKLFNMSKSEFWESVVFYNYLQTFAGLGARQRPKKEQWACLSSAEAFQSVLDHFQPDRILVLGKDLWTNLPSDPNVIASAPKAENRFSVANGAGSRNQTDEVCYWYYAHSGKPALAMPIVHPAAVGFSVSQWIQPVTEWMNFRKLPESNDVRTSC